MTMPSQSGLQSAQKLYRKALSLQQKGRIAEAAKAYEKAMGAAPDHYAILTNLGVCLGLLGRHRKALPLLRRALALRPGEPMIEGALGATLVQLGRAGEAAPILQSALRRAPRDRQAMLFYGLALERIGRPTDALTIVERAAGAPGDGAPPHAAALRELARMYGADVRRAEEAAAAERAWAADPDWIEPNVRAYFARQCLLDWAALAPLEQGAPLERIRTDRTPAGEAKAYLGDPFSLLARTEDAATLRNAAERRANWLVSVHGVTPLAPATPRRPREDAPLKVGYLSSDLRDHAVMHVMAGVFREHDPAQVAIHAYAHGPAVDDPYRTLVTDRAAAFRDLEGLSARAAAERIRADDLDLLIDLNGYTAHARIEIAAFRPAPVQACFLGYPGTTGAPFIDYAIVDARVAPPESAAAFSETLAYHPVCYLPVDPDQPVATTPSARADWGLPESGAVFCSFNQPYKIDPLRFDSWMGLLLDEPGSVLWTGAAAPEVEARFREEAARRGVAPERIVFAERVEKPRHFERLRHATAALDTRLYNGHTTTTDALLADVPVITTEGAHFPGRVAAALLRQCGLGDLVATDEAGYRAAASRLARDPEHRARVGARIAEARAQSPVFSPKRYTRELEALYRAIVARGPQADDAAREPVALA